MRRERAGSDDDERLRMIRIRARERALAEPKVQPFINGKQVVNVIVVPDKLVNIVVKG